MIAVAEQSAKSSPVARGFISLKDEKGWGFIRTDVGRTYFFNARDLPDESPFDAIPLNTLVDFLPVDMSSARAQKPKLKDRATKIRLAA